MKKRKILLGLALASVALFSLSACGGNNGSTTSGEIVTSTDGNEVVDNNHKYYYSTSTEGITLYGIEKKDDKLNKLFIMGSNLTAIFVPDYKDNKIVGLYPEQLMGQNDITYITLGDNFVNNIDNNILFKTEENNLVINFLNTELKIGFDGNLVSNNLVELSLNQEQSYSGMSLKVTSNNSFEVSQNKAKLYINLTDTGFNMKTVDSKTNETILEISKERTGNFENFTTKYSSNTTPNLVAYTKRNTYDSNNRIIKSDAYSVFEYSYYPMESSYYHYDDKGILKSITGLNDTAYKYDEFGRIISIISDYRTEEFEYNDKGLYSVKKEMNKYTSSNKLVYEYDSNNKVKKETAYLYDENTESFLSDVYYVKTYDYQDNKTIMTKTYTSGEKEITTELISLEKNSSITECYNENNELENYYGDESTLKDGESIKDVQWGFSSGKKYIKREITRDIKEDSIVEEYKYYDDSNNLTDETYKYVITLANGYKKEIKKYSYDTETKTYNAEATETVTLTRNNANELIKVEQIIPSNKVVYEYEYKNGVVSKKSSITYGKNDDNQFVKGSKTEVIYDNDNIIEYIEFDYDGDTEVIHLDSKYNKLHDKTEERYYYYTNGELNDESNGYDYTYNDLGYVTSYKSVNYNPTTKKFDIVSVDKTTEYDANYNIVKETANYYEDNQKIILENTIENDLIKSQIRNIYNGETLKMQYKYEHDYELGKTVLFMMINNEWKSVYTYPNIYYANSNAETLS